MRRTLLRRPGRNGRPTREETAAYRAAIRALSWDELEALGLCDCGTLLAVHDPLPRPRQLRSWKSVQADDPRRMPSIWTNTR